MGKLLDRINDLWIQFRIWWRRERLARKVWDFLTCLFSDICDLIDKKFEERKAVHHDEQRRRRDGIDAAYQVRFANYIRPGIER